MKKAQVYCKDGKYGEGFWIDREGNIHEKTKDDI